MASLTNKILETKRLDFVGPTAEQHFSRLKKLMRTFVPNYEVVRKVVQEILKFVVLKQLTTYRGTAWDDHWKDISQIAYDVSKQNSIIDYGNIEYTMLLSLLTDLDDKSVRRSMNIYGGRHEYL